MVLSSATFDNAHQIATIKGLKFNNIFNCRLFGTYPLADVRTNPKIFIHDAFDIELLALSEAVQDELAATAKMLRKYGPQLGRPHADTLEGSKFSNMKEFRFKADNGVWRIAFAFDPKRQAILLVAGDKSGVNKTAFTKN